MIFTNSKSMYRASIPYSGTYKDCNNLDFDPSILKQAKMNSNEKVFWYISDNGTIKGRDLYSFYIIYEIPISNVVELLSMRNNQDVIFRDINDIVYIVRTSSYDPSSYKL